VDVRDEGGSPACMTTAGIWRWPSVESHSARGRLAGRRESSFFSSCARIPAAAIYYVGWAAGDLAELAELPGAGARFRVPAIQFSRVGDLQDGKLDAHVR